MRIQDCPTVPTAGCAVTFSLLLFCRESLSLLDLAFHYGSEQDKTAADILQRRLLQDDTKEAGVLNRITQCMRQFKKHDRRIARQEGRESRAYAVDMVKTMHIVLRVYARLCKESFSVMCNRRGKRGIVSNPATRDATETGNRPVPISGPACDGNRSGPDAPDVDASDRDESEVHADNNQTCSGQVRWTPQASFAYGPAVPTSECCTICMCCHAEPSSVKKKTARVSCEITNNCTSCR